VPSLPVQIDRPIERSGSAPAVRTEIDGFVDGDDDHALIEHYKKDVDRTLLREQLKLTPQQRLERLVGFIRALD